jgi:hypothetical protein
MVLDGCNIITVFVVPSVNAGLLESSFKGLDFA